MSRNLDLYRASRLKLRRMYYAYLHKHGRAPHHDVTGIEAKARLVVDERRDLADLEWQLRVVERERAGAHG